MWTFNFLLVHEQLTFLRTVNAQTQLEFRESGQVQIKFTRLAMGGGGGGGFLGGCDAAGCRSGGGVVSVVVASLVAAECLAGGEGSVADRALVGSATRL